MNRFTPIAATGCFLAIALSITAATPALAGPPDEKVITIEGRAAGTDANAMDQAKQDALRRAVEQACGSFIDGQTQTKNYAAVYDKALSLAAGYVTEFQILERRVEAGVSICKVQATVSTAAFEKEWARLLHTIDAEGNPRCIVVVLEDNNVDDNAPPKTGGVVQSALENFFLKKGVQLMDKAATDEARGRDLALAALNDDVNKLAAMAAAFKADVVIRGVAEARRGGATDLGGKRVHKWSGTLSIRAYHADSAQMLMSNTYTSTVTTTFENTGGDEVLKKCAEENAGRILQDIGEGWRQRQNVKRVCQVTLENCSRDDFKAFEAALRKVDGVMDVRMKELVNSVCQVEVDWSYDLEKLIRRIEELRVPGTSYAVTEQTHDRVTFKLAK
ncbi:MAG TPA: hypothetical protein VMV94_16905 [Phycisphaerae bacterium]|nr:hypothetical protein [Phycisphaerae bacterium]